MYVQHPQKNLRTSHRESDPTGQEVTGAKGLPARPLLYIKATSAIYVAPRASGCGIPPHRPPIQSIWWVCSHHNSAFCSLTVI